jgi:HNH endonuclease
MKNSGQFTAERLKGNQFAKGNKPNRTSFDGTQVMERSPSWKGGLQKTARDGMYIMVGPRSRMPLPRKLWQDVYGHIPKGYVVIHKDGDNMNNEFNNLDCISRAENLTRNRKLL